MEAAAREQLAKKLLESPLDEPNAPPRKPAKPPRGRLAPSGRRPQRLRHAPRHPPTLSVAELEDREQGWNDRFFRDSPSQTKRPLRVTERPAQDVKEKKIQDERQQYGSNAQPPTQSQTQLLTACSSRKPMRPANNGRLIALAKPPTEPEALASKEEKLRFKVLKHIDTRETLIYQLNALILCTPVQDALVTAAAAASALRPAEAMSVASPPQLKPRATMALSSGGGAMTNTREATRLAQKLAADLQLAGIQCVEALVEWMLEAGAKAEKPPPFMWRGRNYFHKLITDLDFADPELRVRGVEVDCFSQQNPLCIRPSQRLGRVLAAHSIIEEMIAVAPVEDAPTVVGSIATTNLPPASPSAPSVHGSGRKARDSGARSKKSKPHQTQPQPASHKAPKDSCTNRSACAASSQPAQSRVVTVENNGEQLDENNPTANVENCAWGDGSDRKSLLAGQPSADLMILQQEERDKHGEEEDEEVVGQNSPLSTRSFAGSPVHTKSNHARTTAQLLRDTKTEEELVDMLDESLSGHSSLHKAKPQSDTVIPAFGEDNNTGQIDSEYDESSFDLDEKKDLKCGLTTQDEQDNDINEAEEPHVDGNTRTPNNHPQDSTGDEYNGVDDDAYTTKSETQDNAFDKEDEPATGDDVHATDSGADSDVIDEGNEHDADDDIDAPDIVGRASALDIGDEPRMDDDMHLTNSITQDAATRGVDELDVDDDTHTANNQPQRSPIGAKVQAESEDQPYEEEESNEPPAVEEEPTSSNSNKAPDTARTEDEYGSSFDETTPRENSHPTTPTTPLEDTPYVEQVEDRSSVRVPEEDVKHSDEEKREETDDIPTGRDDLAVNNNDRDTSDSDDAGGAGISPQDEGRMFQSQNWWQELRSELNKLAPAAPNHTNGNDDPEKCTSWATKRHTIYTSLRSNPASSVTLSPVEEVMAASNMGILYGYGYLNAAGDSLERLMHSDAAHALQYGKTLWDECVVVIDEICSVVVQRVTEALDNKNSLVSELELFEVADTVDEQLRSLPSASLAWLTRAVTLVTALKTMLITKDGHGDNTYRTGHPAHFSALSSHREKQPKALSSLIKIFYPYLINQSRDRLVASWRRVTQTFANSAATCLQPHRVVFLLDATCKCLLLNITSLRRRSGHRHTGQDDDTHDGEGNSDERFNRDLAESVDNDETDNSVTSKFAFVCDRENVLESSVTACVSIVKCLAVSDKSTSTSDSSMVTLPLLPAFILFPFFRSSFGEKLVNGIPVEEGEGKGPLKEWFTLLVSAMAAVWRPVRVDLDDSNGFFDLVDVAENKLIVAGLRHVINPGVKVEWPEPGEDGGGTMSETSSIPRVSRIVNSCSDSAVDTYLLDRPVAPTSFPVSQLELYAPCHAFLRYVQATESYWLNESTPHTAANRETLRFFGWLIGNALVHQCALHLPIHALLFEMILNESHQPTLDDVLALDPSLHAALIRLHDLSSVEFKGVLEMEGLDPTGFTNVDAYIAHTLDGSLGASSSIAWQLTEIRFGLQSVYASEDLRASQLNGYDLSEVLGDAASGSGAEHLSERDFSVERVFRVSMDSDFATCAPLRRAFWSTVNSLTPPRKRQLIKFITGAGTLPQEGAEFLRIEMPFPATTAADCAKTLQMLPQSHTCDNTLELPHYWRALCQRAQHDDREDNTSLEHELLELLTNKLRLAAEYSSGYGLDGTSVRGTTTLASLRPGEAILLPQQSMQDSYDSLDVPALGEGSQTNRSVGGDEEVPMVDKTDETGELEVDGDDEMDSSVVSSGEPELRGMLSRPSTPPDVDSPKGLNGGALDASESSPAAMEEETYGENDWEMEEEDLEDE